MLAGENEHFGLSKWRVPTSVGGIVVAHRFATQLGLAKIIGSSVDLFRGPRPYIVSDQVLSIAHSITSGC